MTKNNDAVSENLVQARALIKECLATQDTYLDLGNCGITNLHDIPELFECDQLEELVLSNEWWDYDKNKWISSNNTGPKNRIDYITEKIFKLENLKSIFLGGKWEDIWKTTDVHFLEKLIGLQTLDLRNNQITDVHFLEKLTGLQALSLRSNKTTDVHFLEKLTGLQALSLRSNKTTDVHFLEKLTGLQTLDLSDNQITDFHFLEKLTGLQILHIGSNKITDIRFLEKLTGLQTLDLSHNQITDFHFLEKLTGLQALSLRHNEITDIRFLEKLTGLQNLELNSNKITDVHFLEKLTGLHTLDLSHNEITDVHFLEKLTGLHTLDLSNNEITDFHFLEKLTGLQKLDLSHNKIIHIHFLEKLTSLHTLDLGNNKITHIRFLENLTSLHTLDLNNNKITDFHFLEKLIGLQNLHIRSNKITDIHFLEKLTGLQKLDLSHNQITDFHFLEKLTGLQILHIGSNKITDFHFLEKLTGLHTLDLRNNQITDIHFLEKLTGLHTLDLRNNQITDIHFLEKLIGLHTLDLSNNEITDFHFLEKLIGLHTLDLSDNQITDIHFLEKLIGLHTLDLSHNEITDFHFLEKLTDLHTLDLSHNQIQEIPEFIFQFPMETSFLEFDSNGLNLFDNPIASPPMEILKQGRQSVLDWFEAKKSKLNEIKIILIGDPKAGKTSLLRRLKDDSFSEDEVQTDGVNIEDIQFGDCETFNKQTSIHQITGHFWDFGGQVIMNATHQFFLTSRSVYILMLDARKDADISGQIRQWLKRVTATGGNSPIIVVANQIDVNTGFGFENEYELQQEFPQVKYFIKASCKTSNNIEIIKDRLAELIPQAEFFQNTEIDERWMQLKETLQKETKPKHYLNEDRFIELCKQCGLRKKSERNNAINFLHDLGIVLHFDDIKRYDYYVLDPFWITYGVYQILTSALAGKNNGIVEMDDLEYIVNEEPDKKERYRTTTEEKIDYTNQQSRFLLEILNQFKLCFRLPDDSKFIIPDLLDTNEPAKITEPIRKATNSIHFVYEYEYLPKFIMPHVIVETHRIYKKIWRTGCVLEGNNCQALVSNYQNKITIIVTGDYKRKLEFMSVIRFLIDTINRELSDKPNMLIPLPGVNAFANYKELLARQKKGEKYYFIYNPIEDEFEISMLLEGVASQDRLQEISDKLDLLGNKMNMVIDKLDKHYAYLINLPANQKNRDEILEIIDGMNSRQSEEITKDILKGISVALDQSTGKIDHKLNEIYADMQKAENIGTKLKLAVPLINFIGIQLETEFDVKGWATKMYQKHKKEMFNTIVNARSRILTNSKGS